MQRYNGVKGKESEMKELEGCLSTSMYYKRVLNDFIEMDFDHPNEFLTNFAKENKVELADPQVQQEFFKARDDHISKINEFYQRNFGNTPINQLSSGLGQAGSAKPISAPPASNVKSNTLNGAKPIVNTTSNPLHKSFKEKEDKENLSRAETNETKFSKSPKPGPSKVTKLTDKVKEKPTAASIQQNIKTKKLLKQSQKAGGWSLSFSGIIVLSFLLVYYLVMDYLL